MSHFKLFLLISIALPLMRLPLQAQSLYVYDSMILSCPNPPRSDAAISQTAWAARHSAISVEKYGAYGAKVKVNSYFTGIAQVQCDYYYYFYINGRMYTQNATTYFNITCKPVEVTLSPSIISMYTGDSQRINCSYSPSNVSPKPTLRWRSINTNVATVDSQGSVTAVGEGQCIIEVLNDMGPDAECRITVNKKDLPATKITVSPSTVSLYMNTTRQLSAKLEPLSATSSVTWTSLNPDVATVDSKGLVTGKIEGQTKIEVKTDNGLTDYAYVTVKPGITDIKILSPVIYEGFTKQLDVECEPSGLNPELFWTSSNPKVATIDQGGRIHGIKSGMTVISVKSDNNVSTQIEITVSPLSDPLKADKIKARLRYMNDLFKQVKK